MKIMRRVNEKGLRGLKTELAFWRGLEKNGFAYAVKLPKSVKEDLRDFLKAGWVNGFDQYGNLVRNFSTEYKNVTKLVIEKTHLADIKKRSGELEKFMETLISEARPKSYTPLRLIKKAKETLWRWKWVVFLMVISVLPLLTSPPSVYEEAPQARSEAVRPLQEEKKEKVVQPKSKRVKAEPVKPAHSPKKKERGILARVFIRVAEWLLEKVITLGVIVVVVFIGLWYMGWLPKGGSWSGGVRLRQDGQENDHDQQEIGQIRRVDEEIDQREVEKTPPPSPELPLRAEESRESTLIPERIKKHVVKPTSEAMERMRQSIKEWTKQYAPKGDDFKEDVEDEKDTDQKLENEPVKVSGTPPIPKETQVKKQVRKYVQKNEEGRTKELNVLFGTIIGSLRRQAIPNIQWVSDMSNIIQAYTGMTLKVIAKHEEAKRKCEEAYKKLEEAYKKLEEAGKNVKGAGGECKESDKKWQGVKEEYYEERKKSEEVRETLAVWKKYDEAYKKYDEAYKKYDEAYKKSEEAYKKYDEAYKKYDEAERKCYKLCATVGELDKLCLLSRWNSYTHDRKGDGHWRLP